LKESDTVRREAGQIRFLRPLLCITRLDNKPDTDIRKLLVANHYYYLFILYIFFPFTVDLRLLHASILKCLQSLRFSEIYEYFRSLKSVEFCRAKVIYIAC